MKTLEPNFFRVTVNIVFWMAIATLIVYLWQGYLENHWWNEQYFLSLLIPFTIFPIITWFMFVPKKVAYSESDFKIQTLFSGSQTFPWSQLRYYGNGNNVFMIKFDGRQVFQILAQAYPKDQWTDFINFLQTTFPKQKSSGFIPGLYK